MAGLAGRGMELYRVVGQQTRRERLLLLLSKTVVAGGSVFAMVMGKQV